MMGITIAFFGNPANFTIHIRIKDHKQENENKIHKFSNLRDELNASLEITTKKNRKTCAFVLHNFFLNTFFM